MARLMLAALQHYAALCAPWPPKGCRTRIAPD